MEKSIENSQQQAEIIKMIALYLHLFDEKYCREAAKEFLNQASRQESMAVLNSRHPQSKNDLLRSQGKALNLLCDYKESLLEVEKLKSQLNKEEQQRNEIDNLFT